MKNQVQLSILMLTHNAPTYVWRSLATVHKRTKFFRGRVDVVVVDNASTRITRYLLHLAKALKRIDALIFNPVNSLFAGGNNIAAQHACKDSEYYLLLNSDIEVRSDEWLDVLLNKMEPHVGAVAFGACHDAPVRADGYAILIRKELFDRFRMDESFQWFWSMTKLEAQILAAGYDIVAFENHEKWLHHFGGKSGLDWQGAKGMDVERQEVLSWFDKPDAGKVIIK